MPIAAGQRFGKYELEAELGAGGMGVVYRAREPELGRHVALKFLHPEHTTNAEILGRFLQEARSAAMIVHPGIVTIFECGQREGVAYIAMELLHGEALGARVRERGRLPAVVTCEIGRQIASALDAAHRAGVVHRDLKPDNIYLVADPSLPMGERVKILDFGIAKLAHEAPSAVRTSATMVFGTPRYMSPEQCRSATGIDHRSDIYTLGVILYELATGEPLFSGEASELVAKHQLMDAPRASRAQGADAPPALDALIARMLAKDPAARPQSMAEVQQALGGREITAAPARPPGPGAGPDTTLSGTASAAFTEAPARRRRWLPLALLGGGAAAAAVIAIAVTAQRGGAAGGAVRPDAAARAATASVDAAVPAAPIDALPAPPPDAARPGAPPAHHGEHPPPLDASVRPPPVDAATAPPPPPPIDAAAPPPLPDAAPCAGVKDRVVDPFANDPCKVH